MIYWIVGLIAVALVVALVNIARLDMKVQDIEREMQRNARPVLIAHKNSWLVEGVSVADAVQLVVNNLDLEIDEVRAERKLVKRKKGK